MSGTSDLAADVPVLTGVADPGRARRSRNWRRVGIGALTLVVVAACVGVLGPREVTATDGVGDMRLEVVHPRITRPGLDSALEIVVERRVGGPIAVTLPGTAFDRLGLETIVPAPTTETGEDGTVTLMFADLPRGDFTLRILGRMPTRSDLGRFEHWLEVRAGRAETLRVTGTTWVLP